MTDTDRSIEVELVKNSLSTIADEMAFTMVRSAYSVGIKSIMDFSTALCSKDGQMLAQGLSLPLHLGSIPDAMSSVLSHYEDNISEGDILCLNDPYKGGMHLPDIFLFKPIFVEKRLYAFAVVVAHHTDVGGRVAGSSAADTTEIFAEGLRIPPTKLVSAGEKNETLFTLLEANVRAPVKLLGDLDAQMAACLTGERELRALAAKYDAYVLENFFRVLLDQTERFTRSAIAEIPDGVYEGVDFIDDDGVSQDPVRIRVTVTIDRDVFLVDFDGTSPQVQGAINATLSFAKSAVYLVVKSLVGPNIPNNAGFMRPIQVTAPEGTVVNPLPPAACGARGVVGYRTTDALFKALAEALPERIPAAGEGGNTGIRVAGTQKDGSTFFFMDAIVGSWGGRPGQDGMEGVAPLTVNISNTPVEIVESEHPIRIESYGFVPDTGGPGRFRGGTSIQREIRLLDGSGTLSIRSDRRKFPPYGLQGGLHGSPSWNLFNPNSGERKLPTKVTMPIGENDLIRHITAGGGGWGNPLEREPTLVLQDVLNEKVTVDHAAEKYGVVVDVENKEVDISATDELRAELRVRRGAVVRNEGVGSED